MRAWAPGVLFGCCLLLLVTAGCAGSPAQSTTAAAAVTSAASTTAVVLSASKSTKSAQLSANPAALDFGSVQVGASATQSLVLSNSGSADANINSVATSDPSFQVSVPPLPFKLSAGYSVTSQVQFAPSAAGNFSATLQIGAAGLPTFTVPLAGAGTSASAPAPTPITHDAVLNWGASASLVDGYNVYRGAASGGPYTRINAALVTGLTFDDTTVVAGQTYYYVVTATAAGVESTYSNEVQAIIPSP